MPNPMTEHSEELLACGHCGKHYQCIDERYGWRVVTCDNCGATGPYPDADTSEVAWNTRSDTALTEALARVRVIEDLLRSIGGVGPFMRARINAALKGTDA